MSKIKKLKNYLFLTLYFLIILTGFFFLYRYYQSNERTSADHLIPVLPGGEINDNNNQNSNISIAAAVPLEVKEKIKAKPPIQAEKPKTSRLVEETVKNNDGTETTIFSSGQASTADIERAKSIQTDTATPLDISYSDETGKYPLLGQTVKDYINSKLRWGNEIGSLKQIVVKEINVASTGWCGLYSGSYDRGNDGKVTAVNSIITLNVYKDCYQNNSELLNDYMKLIISHEYGHHYTLYHKWVDWQLLADTRFPDDYYALRQLNKDAVAIDYSKGWQNCDSEIIAEDYSYFYSGYNHNGMSEIWGSPASSVKAWLEKMPEGSGAVIQDQSPALNITAPADQAEVSAIIPLIAEATDDHGVSRVSFYVDNALAIELTESPYQASVDTTKISEGSHILKVIATDGKNSTEKQISFTVKNNKSEIPDSESPIVNFIQPTANPFEWAGDGQLMIETNASDNIRVTRFELFLNDYKVYPQNANSNESIDYSDIVFRWPAIGVAPGEYNLKAVVYDSAGNKGESALKIIRKSITEQELPNTGNSNANSLISPNSNTDT